jgi:RNA polymerase sigma factor, sigma-70 family
MGKEKLEKILEKCLKGDRKAQKELYEGIGPRLMGICRRYCRVREDAEDALIDAFVCIFTNLGTYRGHSMNELMAWCGTIAVNKCIDRFNARNTAMRNGFDTDFDSEAAAKASVPNMASPDAETILAMVDALPDRQRVVFNLREIDGYGYEEMSEMLGMTVNSLKVNYHRARKSLMKNLKADWSLGDAVH